MSKNCQIVVIKSCFWYFCHGNKNGHIQLSLPLKVLYLQDVLFRFHVTHTLMNISGSFHKILTPLIFMSFGIWHDCL